MKRKVLTPIIFTLLAIAFFAYLPRYNDLINLFGMIMSVIVIFFLSIKYMA